jgi:hypothetical protein
MLAGRPFLGTIGVTPCQEGMAMQVATVSAVSPLSALVTASSTKAGAIPSPHSAGPNLSQAAAPVYAALQSAWALETSSVPAFILPPAGASVLRLFEAVAAIAAERVYPAPIFSFAA